MASFAKIDGPTFINRDLVTHAILTRDAPQHQSHAVQYFFAGGSRARKQCTTYHETEAEAVAELAGFLGIHPEDVT